MIVNHVVVQVEIIRTSGVTFQFDSQFDKENVLGDGYVAKVQGFLHPLGAPSGDGKNLHVLLVVASARCKLYISSDDTPANKVSIVYFLHHPPTK